MTAMVAIETTAPGRCLDVRMCVSYDGRGVRRSGTEMPGAQHTGMCELLRTLRSGRLVNGCSTIPPQYVARQEFHQLFILLRTALNP
ncbi:hypothetical protein [Microbacterium enclense]|uniref:hypothetical protein n=1 Tax=Microbacterium enclense TaxID=993073 RepID=UPI003F7FF425